jgi:hypothetical protein
VNGFTVPALIDPAGMTLPRLPDRELKAAEGYNFGKCVARKRVLTEIG